ncbi:MAG: peptidylprolyl isomerase [Candidatus Magasanikbacteria bacterium RIFCSPHIGHO2_01_FULL_50_8]|uniref:Peptidyl-prolyl cis-trans isomerase n=2 Tax=Candidatus Magasanikiibacteriota TaxID=1752731 RepID=A0A1F6LM37_9BACT|nr:MAG: peptidylprolyl isomerase [Candidatus Magasanikbacteria bacterium RIFCSPHIGHO2_01_FULL_50_8]OGH67675.1 MAG: peptidylprolyl isomerase [Candidatus Magasanikbacteria bacterium RIFCSPHIGHO2_02_FULL_50_9b]
MPKPSNGDSVKIHYTGRLTDGTEFDSSHDRAPLEFVVGSGHVIPGFENAVLDLEPGQTVTVTIPAVDAYGVRREELVATVSHEQFPKNIPLEKDVQIQIPTPDGRTMVATITAIDGDAITLDANHHLAGKDLVFDIELVEIV